MQVNNTNQTDITEKSAAKALL